MMRSITMATAIAAFTTFAGPAAADNGFSLTLPLGCTIGKECFIQQYPDDDLGAGAKDYRCGGETYEGHDGTDLRIVSAKLDIDVLAAAPGRVKAFRDGVDDLLVETPEDKARVKNRECGNGVVIEHEGGWETQYCHMRRGSVVVKKGQAVGAGTPLGKVGYSGDAQFPHMHLSVRRNDKKIDPFLGEEIGASCLAGKAEPQSSLWTPAAREALKYQDSVIIQTGFTAKPFSQPAGEEGAIEPPSAGAEALLFYTRLINLQQGDRLRLSIEGPGGFNVTREIEPFDRSKARYLIYSGKKRTEERWPAGSYRGVIEVIRDGVAIRHAKDELQLQ
jgi:hypothetical protein